MGGTNSNANKPNQKSDEEILKEEVEATETTVASTDSPSSIGKVETREAKQHRESQESVPDNVGWKVLPNDSIPSKFLFNNRKDVTRFKSCDFEHIKHYSMMNEEDPASIDDSINEILRQNCKIGTSGDYRDLTITDKLHVFFTIRDWTLMNNESNNKIYMNFTNSKNGEKKKIEINAQVFEYFDIDEGIMQWYNDSERCFVVKDDSMNRAIKVYIPKVGVVNLMKKYTESIHAKKNRGENVYLDKEFVVYSQYMIKDWREIDDDFDYIEKLRKQFNDFTPEELQIFDYMVGKLKIGIKPTIKVKFDSGNTEVFPMMFREYKSLFYISDKIRTLFTVKYQIST